MSTATFVLRTGKQGNGKTLNSIKEIDQKAHREGRTVYYCNITDFKPDHPAIKATWVEFDHPETWFDLPQNAIIVIDEAQTWFRVRPQGSKVPLYASRLEIMRKDGHELHAITQSPKLIDSHMRELCGMHIHYYRGRGGKFIKRWEFDHPVMSVGEKLDFPDGQSTRITIDSAYFGCYKSVKDGTEHHFKFSAPRALYLFVACLVLLGLAAWKISGRVMVDAEPVAEPAQAPQPSKGILATASPASMDAIGVDEYIAARTPRVADVPSSAPIYDQIAKPVTFPKPFCVSTGDVEMLKRNARRMTLGYDEDGKLTGCRCNSQQGTRIDVSFDFCMNVVSNGLFDDTKPDRQFAPASHRDPSSVSSVRPSPDVQLASLVSSSTLPEPVEAQYVPRPLPKL